MDRAFNHNRATRSLLYVFIILISLMSFADFAASEFDSTKWMTMSDINSELCGESKEGKIGAENNEPSDNCIYSFVGYCFKFPVDVLETAGCRPISVYSHIPDKPVNPPRA